MADSLKCPICGLPSKPLDKTGDADGFNCPKHASFKVSGSALRTKASDPQGAWEAALNRAQKRCATGEWPVIGEYDF